ncbi:MAG: hypothetical protein WCE75_13865 [Terracidiphilus sp.]
MDSVRAGEAGFLPAGGVTVSQVRDPVGVLQHEKAEIGVFLCFEPPTKPMLKEAAEAGFYRSPDGTTYPRVQILTIEEILGGRQPLLPAHHADATFKKAPRSGPAQWGGPLGETGFIHRGSKIRRRAVTRSTPSGSFRSL